MRYPLDPRQRAWLALLGVWLAATLVVLRCGRLARREPLAPREEPCTAPLEAGEAGAATPACPSPG